MKTGFIGLGAMGAHMARRLNDAGYLSAVFNRTTSVARTFAETNGCAAATSIRELAAMSECVVLCVSADRDVLEIVAELATHLPASGLVIDCSTVSAETARTADALLRERNIGFLDCPVSGGTEGARNGTLAIMAGGTEQDFERAQPVLACFGHSVTHMGPAGAGQATKAINQVMVAGINQTVTEALAFAEAEGLPLDKVIETVGAGAAANWFLDHRGKTMVRGKYPLGFKVSLHKKDLEICRAMAAKHAAGLPLVEMTLLHYRRLLEQGHGDDDISSLFTLKRWLFERAREEDENRDA